MMMKRFIFVSYLMLAGGAVAQDADVKDRNEVNTTARPGSMMEDSPVKFPKKGALPSKYNPDIRQEREDAEKDYFIFASPCRSLKQIEQIQQQMPKGEFKVAKQDWFGLTRTHKVLTEGGNLHIMAVGDSIVNDIMRSGWTGKLAEAYPKAKIKTTVYVRGGGGCQHYSKEGRVQKYIIPRKPDLVYIGGISQRSVDAIREVMHQIRKDLPQVEFFLTSGVFGTTDPRNADVLAKAQHSGSSDYGKELEKLAREEGAAYLDMTTPWAQYIVSSGLHPHRFYRDAVHANADGEQILSKILMAWWGENRH
ncbi:MAG: SGNH/GDSL hydrolase family protein [Verrucomicrobiales bacterium]|nr:SGNH/GDSL hydrolase family protein [Verrucomicrobiales bacterium]